MHNSQLIRRLQYRANIILFAGVILSTGLFIHAISQESPTSFLANCPIKAHQVDTSEVFKAPNQADQQGRRQGLWCEFMDSTWKTLPGRENAHYFRLKNYIDGKICGIASDYYLSGYLQGQAYIKSENPDINSEGSFNQYHPNGNIMSCGYFKNEKQNGLWKRWYENGKKLSEGNVVDNKEDGMWTYWDSLGNPAAKGVFKNGMKQYSWTVCYSSDNTTSFGNYIDDKKEGTWSYFYGNGIKSCECRNTGEFLKQAGCFPGSAYRLIAKKQAEGNFKNDKTEGIWSFWDSTGNLFNQPLISYGAYRNGKKEGTWIEENSKDSTTDFGSYVNGVKCDQWFSYLGKQAEKLKSFSKLEIHSSGKNRDTIVRYEKIPAIFTINSKGEYRNGLKEGEWLFRGSNCKGNLRGLCIHDFPEGKWVVEYDSGKKGYVFFKNGKFHGDFMNWYENGSLEIGNCVENSVITSETYW